MPKSKRSRRHYTTEQKAEILKEHLVDGVLVSEVCNKHQLQPSVFYDWLKQVHGNLVGALTTPAPAGPSKREKELQTSVRGGHEGWRSKRSGRRHASPGRVRCDAES